MRISKHETKSKPKSRMSPPEKRRKFLVFESQQCGGRETAPQQVGLTICFVFRDSYFGFLLANFFSFYRFTSTSNRSAKVAMYRAEA